MKSLLADLRSSDANFITIWLPPGDRFSRVEDLLSTELFVTDRPPLQSSSLHEAMAVVCVEGGEVQGDGVVFFVGYTDAQEHIAISYKGPYAGGPLQDSLYLMDSKFHLPTA